MKRETGRVFSRWFLLMLLCTVGCGDAPKPEATKPLEVTPVQGGVFRRAFASTGLSLDPREVADSFSHEVCRQMYDGLVEFDQEARVSPVIAESWQVSADRLTYTFKLRRDVKFHQVCGENDASTLNAGRVCTAEDVDYTFHRLLDPAMKSQRGQEFLVIRGATDYATGKASRIDGIKVLASDSLSMTLEKPFSPFLQLLALSNAFIVPADEARRDNPKLGALPVGSGPFRYAGWKGETLILKANPDYFRGRPYLDTLEFPIIRDEKERFAAFKRGELLINDVPDPEYKNVKTDPSWAPHFQETSRWGTYYIGFNVGKPPFDNPKVRQAINYAIDRETIVNLILNGRARVAKGVLPPGILGYNPNLKGYSYDLPRAKKLLAEAGYPDGKGFPEISLQYNRDPAHVRSSEFILANLRDLGITCTLKEVEFTEHLRSVENGDVGFFRMGWTVDYPDPDNFLFTLFHSSNFGAKGNFTRYANPRLDELLEKARFELDARDRIPIYHQAEQMVVDDAPWVFVYHYTTHVIAQPQVRGLRITPLGLPFVLYRQLWLAPAKGG
ncbi:MAG TPA: ABC transporter substrate-binding protein [Candidatus Ozemobacteraceae bacterium]|nr:ABC transporter substrate-binding protein [Candidatus Ozemobacteraceae bacterium]